ncbi:ABC transporter permease [Francisella sp. 19X1-34]|uniref:ABC transporter permease n=1 Tax=Francisella sp. 19X1-34 TaxID=3087177 RepID=UPI002E374CE4|nr:ABC transporter permease [Francisella sp. 19X1-34]MED7787554.1 ABC transporter permease [Francisella sp. 19X1-34]
MLIKLKTFFLILFKNKYVIVEMTKRDLSQKYAGQVFGKLWVFLHPIFMLSVYVLIFTKLLPLKTGVQAAGGNYAVYILSGLTAWLVMQEAIMKSTIAINTNSSIIKQVVFPLEVLPIKAVLGSMINMIIYIIILFIYMLFIGDLPSYMLFLLPIIIYMQFIFVIGLSFILSSVGVYLKDLKDMIQMFTFIAMFLLPVIYHPDQLPNILKPIIYLNPFSYIIFCYQDVFYYQSLEHWYAWIIVFMISHLILVFGIFVFEKLKVFFSDIL